MDKVVIVYIEGFLAQKKRESTFPHEKFPPCFHVIEVFPSGASSLHDRSMSIFFELKGGQVHYGDDHSKFHGHSSTGQIYKGKFKEWNENQPIHIIAHSYGGLTALCLEYYLALETKFAGHLTNASWVASITTIDSPLNGSLMVYSLGANTGLPCCTRWCSPGYIIGLIAHIFGYIDATFINDLYDFQLGHWGLSHRMSGSLLKLVNAMLGVCVHTSTDNSAYDMTIHSQIEWSKHFHTNKKTFYLNIIGTSYRSCSPYIRLLYSLPQLILRKLPTKVANVDTSAWFSHGFDGLLSHYSQSSPRLQLSSPPHLISIHDILPDILPESSSPPTSAHPKHVLPGIWYTSLQDMDHLGLHGWSRTLELVSRAVQLFSDHKKASMVPQNETNVNKSPESLTSTSCNELADCPHSDGSSLDDIDGPGASGGDPISIGGPGTVLGPDMQVPKWTYRDRPEQPFQLWEYVTLLFVYGYVLGVVQSESDAHSYTNELRISFSVLIPVAVSTMYLLRRCLFGTGFILTSDHSQFICCSLRLLLLVITLPALNHYPSSRACDERVVTVGSRSSLVLRFESVHLACYAASHALEMIISVIFVRPLEYRCSVLLPMMIILVNKPAEDTEDQPDIWIFMCVEAMFIIPKLAWFVTATTYYENCKISIRLCWYWIFMWICLITAISMAHWLAFCGCRITSMSDKNLPVKVSFITDFVIVSALRALIFVISAQKIRDMSDAYQTFFILSKYSKMLLPA